MSDLPDLGPRPARGGIIAAVIVGAVLIGLDVWLLVVAIAEL